MNNLTTAAASRLPHPENIEAAAKGSSESRVHSAFSAPGNLLQSDLLQSLGSALASRSDTFKLRCYGEAAQIDGKTGSAWLEVIVQRVPGFIDPTNAAETGNSAPRPLMIPTAPFHPRRCHGRHRPDPGEPSSRSALQGHLHALAPRR